MKKYLKGFTVAETLLTLCIIGVIAALTLPVIGSKVDRNKGLFKKVYSATERTVGELINDGNYYVNDPEKFGFLQDDDVKIVGTDYYTSTTNFNERVTTGNSPVDTLVKFCNLFSNNFNIVGYPEVSTTECKFTSNDGVDWVITKTTSEVSGFLIQVDTNGSKVPNLPADYSDIATNKNAGNRDRFFMLVRYDGKIWIPQADDVAMSYLKSADINRE